MLDNLRGALVANQEGAEALLRFKVDRLRRFYLDIPDRPALDAIEALEPLLRDAAVLQRRNGPMHQTAFIRHIDGGGVQLNARTIAFGLLTVMAEKGPDEAIVWLKRISEIGTTPARTVIAIHGLVVDEPVEIAGYKIIPRNAVERTPAYVKFLGRQQSASEIFSLDCVAVREIADHAWLGEVDGQPVEERTVDLQSAMYAIAYSDGGAPSIGERYSELLHPDIQLLSDGESYSWPQENAPRSLRPVTLTQAGIDAITQHLNLHGDIREAMDLAASRLALSRRRAGPADGWVDAAIALESLLGEDRFDLTYKISLRAGILTGESAAGRLDNQKLVKDGYAARSAVVHGSVKAEKALAKVRLEDFQNVAAAVIRRIAAHGELPDWPTFDLSGGTDWAPEALAEETSTE